MIKTLLGVARLNFLTLTLVCIALAASITFYSSGAISGPILLLVLMMALTAHISVNAFNEYFDFKSGLDFLTDKTPFSGGSGSLINQPDTAAAALVLASSSLLLVIAAGLYLTTLLGWQLLLIGIPGVVLIYAYTQYINRSPLLCLLAPGIGFGFLMTLGASWVLSGQLNPTMFLSAGIVCCLVSNLLLLNQFPDVEADRQVGRRHYPIILGRPRSVVIFAFLLLLSYLSLLGGIITAILPQQSALTLLSLPLAIALGRGVQRFADQPKQLPSYLALNVGFIHVFIVLLTISLFWAGSGRGAS